MIVCASPDPTASTKAGYGNFVSDGGDRYGSFEVFWHDAGFFSDDAEAEALRFGDDPPAAGWYWWACFPGCMPDGEPDGPYPTSEAASCAAQATD